MNRRCALLLPFIALCAAAPAAAFGEKDNAKPPPIVIVEVSGIVRMVGNSPMNTLIMSDENRDWRIAAEEQEKLMPFQQQIITVQGEEYYYDRTFANGVPAGRQYYLKNIVIIRQ